MNYTCSYKLKSALWLWIDPTRLNGMFAYMHVLLYVLCMFFQYSRKYPVAPFLCSVIIVILLLNYRFKLLQVIM